MTTEIYIQNFLKKAIHSPLKFHAYYWGTFVFTPIEEAKGYSFFAKAQSSALDYLLSFKGDDIYLHSGDSAPFFITANFSSFMVNQIRLDGGLIFDCRVPLHKIFSSREMYISHFRDPEDFEEVDAYVKLVEGIDRHFKNLIGMDRVTASEISSTKTIKLHFGAEYWDINIEKELFDTNLLHALNQLIHGLGNEEETLHLTINPEMYMVILKLDSEKLYQVKMMGVIV